MYTNQEQERKAFFSIHSLKALKEKQFSIVRANIENTPDKVEIARRLYPAENWLFEFHNFKFDSSPIVD